MATFFLDSSAVVKLYVTERGSQWVRSLLDPDIHNEISVSVITGPEVISAITRRRRTGSLDPIQSAAALAEFLDDWHFLFNHAAINEHAVETAMQLAQRHELRGYDAMQLATAIVLRDDYRSAGVTMVLISADDELNTAASAEGLQVENPNRY